MEHTTERTSLVEIGQGMMTKPLQRPHPPIVVTAVAPFSKGVTEAASRGWDPSRQLLMPHWAKTHWPKYVEGCERAGRPPILPTGVSRSLFLCVTILTRRANTRWSDSPYRFYSSQLLTKMRNHNRVNLFKSYPDQPDDEVTLDSVCDKLIIWGTPDKVADDLLAFHDEIGDFGRLLYAGKDWADPQLGRQSMIMLAVIMPVVNAAIGHVARTLRNR